MNIIMTCQPGMGHFTPLIPLARALQARGATITVATAKSFGPKVTEAGFQFLPAGLDFHESDLENTMPEIMDVPEDKKARWLLDELFLKRAPIAMFNELIDILPKYDLVIHTHYELGAQLAAEKLGIPYVCCNVSFVVNREVMKIIQGRQMQELRKKCGLPVDKQLRSIGKYLDIRLMTPGFTFLNAMTSGRYRKSLRAELFRAGKARRGLCLKMLMATLAMGYVKGKVARQPRAENERYINNWSYRADLSSAPSWLQSMPKDRPTVYVSLGTVFNSLYPETFKIILDGLNKKNINIVVTTGNGVDVSSFGPQPSNVYIKSFVPQEYILPYADLCINHGGFGTTMGALSHGIPQINFPLSADQPVIASIVAAYGASVPLPHRLERMDAEGAIGFVPGKLTPSDVSNMVDEAFNNPIYKKVAEKISEELRQMDSVEDTAEDVLSLILSKNKSVEIAKAA